MNAYSPTGVMIIGTLDTCPARAEIMIGSFERLPDGTLDHDWEGGTEIFWDDQKTVQRDGKNVYLDEDGEEWTEDQLILCEGEFVDPFAPENVHA